MKRIRRLLAPPEGPRAGLTPVLSAVILTATLLGVMAAWQARPADAAPAPQAVPAQAPAQPQVTRPLIQPHHTPDPATLETVYRKWLNEDVAYIITDEERAAFKRLQTNEEREHFIETFWIRRDPTPGTPENEFKEEHYRRIAYANEHFSPVSGLPGWKTDRGRIYITYGPPDEIDSHPHGGTYERPPEQGGGSTTTVPFEQWRYRFIQGVGNNVIIEFVDPNGTGEYRMTNDPSEKDALAANSRPAGAKVQMVGRNGVQLTVPLDSYGDHPLSVYVRIVGADGRAGQAIEQSVRGQLAFSTFLALDRGSYRINVTVKDLTAGTIASDTLPVEVR